MKNSRLQVVALTKDLQSHDAEKARLLDALAAEKRKVAEVRADKDSQVASLGEKLGVLQGERAGHSSGKLGEVR